MRLAPADATRPAGKPIATGRMPSRTIIRAMSRLAAPMAIRTPISFVRWLTECAITATSPTAASTSAITAKTGAMAAYFPRSACSRSMLSRSKANARLERAELLHQYVAIEFVDFRSHRLRHQVRRHTRSHQDKRPRGGLLPERHVDDRFETLPRGVALHDVGDEARQPFATAPVSLARGCAGAYQEDLRLARRCRRSVDSPSRPWRPRIIVACQSRVPRSAAGP